MTDASGNVIHIDGRDRRPWALISKTKLLDAAVAEIAERGYDRARLVDIAARADLTVGALYNWYENKADLFNAALEHAISLQQQANLKFISERSTESPTGLANSHWLLLIASLMPRQQQDAGPTDAQKMLIEALSAAWRDEESQRAIQPHLAALVGQYEDVIQTAMNDGGIDKLLDAKLLARMLLAFPIGLSLLSLSGLPDISPAKFILFVQRLDEVLKPR